MYRKPSGAIGVSFTRFMNNVAPSIMIDSSKDPGHISMPQRDMFYSHQMSLDNPYAFDGLSLVQSGILDNDEISRKAFHKLQKTGVLDAQGNVDTMKIGPNFTHDMAIISAVRQKQIIDLLFWWEEECQRLRKLQDEKAELVALVESARADAAQHGRESSAREQLDQMTLLLDRVNLKISQRPSQRREDLERDEDEVMMRYRNATENAMSASSQPDPGDSYNDLPAYHA